MNSAKVTELELELLNGDGDSWLAVARATAPDADEPRGISGPDAVEVHVDLDELLDTPDEDYGAVLTDGLFGPPDELNRLGQFFLTELQLAQRNQRAVRLRVAVGPRAERMHGVRWELLRDLAHRERYLMENSQVFFSRYLDSTDARTASLRSWGSLRALVVVAGWQEQKNLTVKGAAPGATRNVPLTPTAVDDEIARARASLPTRDVIVLGAEGNATVNRVFEALGTGVDVLYLVCHGYIQPRSWVEGFDPDRVARDPDAGDARLVLHNDQGEPVSVRARDFTMRFQGLRKLPRLAVLVSCQSAGDGVSSDRGALAALGPQLAREGVPAVVAMQANVRQATAATFVPKLFQELMQHQVVDMAFAAARQAVRAAPDWWVPVLFTRLRSGRVAYPAGFVTGGDEPWTALIDNIRQGVVTPVLGPRLTAPYVGTHRDIAREWARTFEYPLEPPFDSDLPQVTQYLAKKRGPLFPRNRLRTFVGVRLLKTFPDELKENMPERLEGLDVDVEDERITIERRLIDHPALLDELLSAVVRVRRAAAASGGHESHSVLARLRLPLYLTTQPWSLLPDALREEHELDPTVAYLPWRDDAEWEEIDTADDAELRGTAEDPLVYHLFGHVKYRNSVVLTEDDYFEFLFRGGDNKLTVPRQVRSRIVESSLLLLGFGIDEWPFRVLFRFIRSLPRSRVEGLSNLAVQVDPEESTTRNAQRLRDYLGMQLGSNFDIYWGTAEEFLAELAGRYR